MKDWAWHCIAGAEGEEQGEGRQMENHVETETDETYDLKCGVGSVQLPKH